jgi:superfamily II DNA/RNA helicase
LIVPFTITSALSLCLCLSQIIIFAHHRTVIDHVSKWLKDHGTDSIRIDGGTMSKERQKKIEKFQTLTSCRVALLSITSAGVAITLTAASTVYFAELFWTPASLLQAEDRAHRIGQTAEVQIFYFRATGTVDDILWPMLQHKIKTLGEVFEGVKFLDIDTPTPPPTMRSTEARVGEEGEGEVEVDGEEQEVDVERLLTQLAEEACEGTGAGDEDEEVEDPPLKKQKQRAAVGESRVGDHFPQPLVPLSHSSLSLPTTVPSSQSRSLQHQQSQSQSQTSSFLSESPTPPAVGLDQRRIMRAARIKLLREQQSLSLDQHPQPLPSQPIVISLLDDEECDSVNEPSALTFSSSQITSLNQEVGETETLEEEDTRSALEMLSEIFSSSSSSELFPPN